MSMFETRVSRRQRRWQRQRVMDGSREKRERDREGERHSSCLAPEPRVSLATVCPAAPALPPRLSELLKLLHRSHALPIHPSCLLVAATRVVSGWTSRAALTLPLTVLGSAGVGGRQRRTWDTNPTEEHS